MSSGFDGEILPTYYFLISSESMIQKSCSVMFQIIQAFKSNVVLHQYSGRGTYIVNREHQIRKFKQSFTSLWGGHLQIKLSAGGSHNLYSVNRRGGVGEGYNVKLFTQNNFELTGISWILNYNMRFRISIEVV